MDSRDSFVFYRSFYEAIKDLDIETQWIIFKSIVEYGLDGVLPEIDGVAKAVFLMAKPQLDANYRRYANGKKGGAPKGSRNNPHGRPKKELTENKPRTNQELTENKPNVNANVNENVNVNENDNVNVIDSPFVDNNKAEEVEEFKSNTLDSSTVAAINQLRRMRKEKGLGYA